jgi:EAL domain-containing protein (putative c-di-GMP-specific phosphodiesterase class I)
VYGGNQFVFIADCPDINSTENLFLESELRWAIERSELEIYYQPQINMRTGCIVGAEALMRWNHPEKGMIPPSTFIPMAEESGQILQMGEWILQKACMSMKQWNNESEVQCRIAVNLSGYQFNRPDLIERLTAIFRKASIDPRILELEITESVLIQQPANALKRMKELKDLGVHICLDDFGTGYSSFAYLKQFPFDALKIDRSFIANVHDDPKSSAIVTAIIQMAHSMNTKIIAEGVETMYEYEFLKQHGCEEVQGYLFSPPVPENKFCELMNNSYVFST